MDRSPKAFSKPKEEEVLRRKLPGWGARHPECACFLKTDIKEIEDIGEGQQGKVVKARVPLFGICAVKYLLALDRGSFVADSERLAYRELVAAQKLAHHPNIVNFYGTVQNNKFRDVGFVTEFMEGGNLFQLIHYPNANLETEIPDDEWEKYATRWAIQIARALAYCHAEKVLHRDVKPENTLLSQDRLTIKLCDFGVARPSTDTPNSCNRGSVFYMAPEVFQEYGFKTEYDSSADVFSYAMFLYTLFHKKYPYIGQAAVAIDYFNALRRDERPILYDNLPNEIRDIITDCWKTNREERKTMKEVTERLERYWNRMYPREEF